MRCLAATDSVSGSDVSLSRMPECVMVLPHGHVSHSGQHQRHLAMRSIVGLCVFGRSRRAVNGGSARPYLNELMENVGPRLDTFQQVLHLKSK
jgi:hypothetical protein